jgi:hypothetical protein
MPWPGTMMRMLYEKGTEYTVRIRWTTSIGANTRCGTILFINPAGLILCGSTSSPAWSGTIRPHGGTHGPPERCDPHR